MPAQSKICFHIFNKGIEGNNIFKDASDFNSFILFLEEYLRPKEGNSTKTTFSIKGRTYQGVPHQPKNYFGKIELLHYHLSPDHFHLVIHEISQGSRERFMRSLLTRYSMYFNKRYKRSGTLFRGPYKFARVGDKGLINLLVKTLGKGRYSSYGIKTDWLENKGIDFEKTMENISQKDLKALERIIFESIDEHISKPKIDELERRDLPLARSEENNLFYGVPELILGCLIFLLLFAIGLRNVKETSRQNQNLQTVSGVSDGH